MVFHPSRAPGLVLGLVCLAGLLGLAVGLLAALGNSPLSGLSFLYLCLLLACLPALAWLAGGVYGLARARYVVSRNALVIEWGGRREVTPAAQVGAVRLAADIEGEFRLPGLPWPGWTVSRAEHSSLGPVEFLAAGGSERLVMVELPSGWLVISPEDPAAFLAAWEAARAQGPETEVAPESAAPALPAWPLWTDRLALGLLAAGGLGPLSLAGYLLWIFPQLPPQIALHFDAAGRPDRFGPPGGLLILPLLAGLTWALNFALGSWLHSRLDERPAAYLLFGATVFVQLLAWAAGLSLLTAGGAA